MSKVYTRVHNQKYTDEQWSELNPVLQNGELVLVSVGDSTRIKMGDGVSDYQSLPFIDSDFRDSVDSNVNTLNSRINNLITNLPTDSDGVALEVADIRSGIDNVVYESAGDAVRSLSTEINQIQKNMQNISIDPNDLGLEQDETTGLVYITFKGVKSVHGIPLASTGGGGGSAATSIFKLRTATESQAFSVALGSKVEIAYTFSSVDSEDGIPTGKGTASYYVGDSLVYNESIDQGTVTFDCGEYLSPEDNKVRVTVKDSDGNTKSLIWDIYCVDISITSIFDYTKPSEDGNVTFKYTAYGNVEKTIHFILDDVEQPTATVASSGRQSTTTFTGLGHGLHTLDVYATAEVSGSTIESNHLKYDIIVTREGSVTPVISINNTVEEVLQGELVDIPYIVYDPLSTESTVSLDIYKRLDDGSYELYDTDTRTVNRSIQHWITRDYPVGIVKFSVTLRDVNRSTVISVKENSLPISPTVNDLELHLSAANRSNSEVSPDTWSDGDITTEFDNVNWASSGWIADESGDTALHLEGGSTATIRFKPFSSDLRIYGKTLEFDFAVRDVNNRDANVISSFSGGLGIKITADRATLKSSLSEVTCRFSEERRVRVSFVIESRSEYRLMSIYLDGVLTCTKQYVDTDNFQQSPAVDISIGSPYCSVDLYTVRSYSTALTQEDLLNNYICDISDVIERNTVYDANDLYDSSRNLVYEKVKTKIPVMTITGPLPQSKGDKKTVTVSYEDPKDKSMNFSNLTSSIDVQGTSSQWYVRKNYKLKFKQEITHIKGAIPSKVFTVKADYAEATGTHNTQIANMLHYMYSDKTPAQEVDSRYRTTVQGFPMVIYHKADEDSVPEFLGKYNFNYDKGSEAVFGFTSDYDVESWEFKNNDAVCNFIKNIPADFSIKDGDLEVGWKNDFERRYPDDDLWENNEALARFRSMHDWVVSTSEYDLSDSDVSGQYREEFESRFNLHKCLIYYVFTFFMLMIDQRAKNMFLTYWGETGKWEPWFYDNDTCLGIDNKGNLTLDYYHEDTDVLPDGTQVYNGQDSVLWNKFRVAYAKEIQETYQDLRNNGKLTYDVLRTALVTNGSDKWSKSIYNEDSDFKYISMLRSDGDASNIPQVRGTGEHDFEYIADGRFDYCDSKWYASEYADDFIKLRAYTPETYGNTVPSPNITVTPFSTMYAGIRYMANGTLQQERVEKGIKHTFIAPLDKPKDVEIAVYGASQLSSIGNLSALYSDTCDVSKATRLIELILGTDDETYVGRLKTLSLGTNRLLKKLDIRNCATLTDPVDLTGCPGIEEIYAEGSGISSLLLADSGYLKVVHLPETVTSLTFKNQKYVEDFSIASYANITDLNIESSLGIPIADILLNTPLLNRVRLINAEWSCTQQELSDLYEKLLNCSGIDERGYNCDKAVVSGIVSVPDISRDLLEQINTDFPELMVSVNGKILCTVSYYNTDGTLLYVTTVERGTSAPDIVADGTLGYIPDIPTTDKYSYEYAGWSDSLEDIKRSKSFVVKYEVSYAVRFHVAGEIKYTEYVKYGASATDPITSGNLDTPTKESTAQYHYTFRDWDVPLTNVQEYRDVHAVFSETLRSYEVSFYNEDVLLKKVVLDYGTSVEYIGKTPEKLYVDYPQDYTFLGWTPELGIVEGETQYQALFSESDHILDDWQTISNNVANGTYKDLYPVGILQRVTLSHLDGTTEEIDVELVGYDHDITETGSTTGLTFITKGLLKKDHIMNNSQDLNKDGWEGSDMRSYLNDSILPAIPEEIRSLIKPVMKKTSAGGGSDVVSDIVSTVDTIWTPSLIELFSEYSNQELYAAEGKTYEYFTGQNDQEVRARRTKIGRNGYSDRYWLRSPVMYNGTAYWMVSTEGGSISIKSSYATSGVVFGFCIGVTPESNS